MSWQSVRSKLTTAYWTFVALYLAAIVWRFARRRALLDAMGDAGPAPCVAPAED